MAYRIFSRFKRIEPFGPWLWFILALLILCGILLLVDVTYWFLL